MSGGDNNSPWSVIGHAVGSVLGGVFGPVSLGTAAWLLPGGFGAAGGVLDWARQRGHGDDGGEDKGAAAAAEQEDNASLQAAMKRLAELDASARQTLEKVTAAGKAGQEELDKIQQEIKAKVAEMEQYSKNGELSAKEFKDFAGWLQDRLEAAKQVLAQANSASEEQARKTAELTSCYGEVANNGNGGGEKKNAAGNCSDNTGAEPSKDATGGADSGGVGGGGSGSDPAATAPASADPAGQQPAGAATGLPGMGMGMPGMGGGMPMMPGLPPFGGGGIPGFGDPLSALSGLGSPATPADGLGLKDEAAAADNKGGDDGLKLQDTGNTAGDGAGTTAAGTDHPGVGQVDNDSGHASSDDAGEGKGAEGSAKSTEVQLPSGETTEARSATGAAAVRAALDGSTVAEAYQKAGITLPPPGTPVTEPVPPTQLRAGDIGVWKDHMVMALGNGKVLVSGQVQPLESVGSGPDFLGWIDPTASGGLPPQQTL